MSAAVIDSELQTALARVQAGDRDAYGVIVARCQDALRAALGGFARSAEELEDFCHLALVNAYFHLRDYSPERGPFLPWLVAVAKNAVLEELRRRRAEGRRLFRYVERGLAEGTDPDDLDRAREALEGCLSQLDPSEARLLRDHYRRGRGCEEIASALGKTGLAVRKMLQRLRERLRICVERRMVGEDS